VELEAAKQTVATNWEPTPQALAITELRQLEADVWGHQGDARRLPVLEKAYATCLADIERLYPHNSDRGVSNRERTLKGRIDERTRQIEDFEQEADGIRAWLAGVPEDAASAKKLAEDRLSELDRAVNLMTELRRNYVAALGG